MRWVGLIILFLGMMINFADKAIVGLAAGPLMEEFGLTYAQWGVIGSSFYWIFPIAAIMVGAITDKLGSKKVLGYMLLAWSVIQFGGYVIAGFSTLLLYRILLGFSEGGYSPAGYRQLFRWFPSDMRGRVNTIFNAGATVGAFAVTPLIVALIEMISWRHTFALMGLFSLILYVVWTVIIPKQSPNLQDEEEELVSIPKSKFKWSEFYPILLSPTCLFTLLASFGFFCLVTWMAVWMPLYLVKVVHFSKMEMGYATAAIGAISVTAGISLGMISDRVFKKTQNLRKARVLVTGTGMLAGALILGSLYIIHSPLWAVIAFGLANGLGVIIAAMSHIIMSHQLPERTATFSGVIVAVQNIAGVVSPIITGFIVQFAGKDNVSQGFNYSLLTVSSIMLITTLLFTIFVKPDRQKNKNSIVDMTDVAAAR